jgi:hypothetical protein
MGYIFEAEIDSIIHSVRIKTIGEDDGIILKKILAAHIHPAVKAYFRAEVEKLLQQERGLEYRSKKFPYSLPEVRSLEDQIDLLLIQNYNFSSQEFELLLDESVHFQFNYLCRPQWTLLNFVVGDQRRIVCSAVEKKLRYCVDYKYFPELIKRYISDHGLAEVTYEEFKSLIEKIDNEVVARHSSLELAHMTRALFDFVESGKMVPQVEFEQQTLPINAAIVFFEDKHLSDIKMRLEFERDRNRVIQITVDRLADVIEVARTGIENASASPVQIPPELPIEPEEAPLEQDDPLPEVIAVKEQESEPVITAPQEENRGAPKAPFLVFGENDDKYLSSLPGMKQKELFDLFNEDERKIFIKKLFSNDEPAFRSAMAEISLMRSWKQVAPYLDKLFLTNEVDPFGAEAVLFTDRLSMHFQLLKAGK